jgi:SHS2 domain-containing protein
VTYAWVDHTAELELRIEAPTLEQVYADAAAAFGELVRRVGGDPYALDVGLDASDRAALLVEWLENFVFSADTLGFVPERVRELTIADTSLAATVDGIRGEPAPLVKAVTYHGLELEEKSDGFRARVVLDV